MNYLIPIILLLTFSSTNLLGIRPSVFPANLAFSLLGIVLFFIVRKIGMPFFRVNARTFYLIFLALLLITFIIGIEVKGSQRWIDIGFTRFQPSEFFKVFFIIYFADLFTKVRKSFHLLSLFIAALIAFIIPTLIVFKQPDLGNALVYSFTFGILLLFSGIPSRYLIIALLVVVILMPVGWISLRGYQRDRVVSFLLPHTDRQGTSYNMTQALISIGSGSFTGRGLGTGTQSRLAFLPENHTDFAFSSLIEQFGFVGGLGVIALIGYIAMQLVRTLIRLIKHDDDQSKFHFYYVLGLFSSFMFHAAVNMGMNMGIVPVTGITLPFISYGGSSLLTWWILFGLVPK